MYDFICIKTDFLLFVTNRIEEEDLKAFSFSTLVAKRPMFTEEDILLIRVYLKSEREGFFPLQNMHHTSRSIPVQCNNSERKVSYYQLQ